MVRWIRGGAGHLSAPPSRGCRSRVGCATIAGMNILKSLAVKDIEEATRAIPVIDFSPAFRSPADPEGLEAVAREARHAGETVGVFYLAGPGGPDAGGGRALPGLAGFHAL